MNEVGVKSDVIGVMVLDQTKEVQEYAPTTVAGREYNAKDNLASLKNFFIELTDAWGNGIPFEEVGGFTMELAIWMQPPDPTLYSMWLIL